MHELSVVAGLFELLEEQAGAHKAKRITAVKLRIGQLSGIVPELFKSAFEMYKKETLAAEAKLEIKTVPVRFRCRTCGGDSFMENEKFACASCGARSVELLEGRELVVEKIELETDID